MPRVLVTTDDSKREILLDELVNPEHLGNGHSADQLKEMHDHLENLKQRGVEAIEE